MIDQTTMFWMTLGPWPMIIGMTILVVLVNYLLFRLYQIFSPQEQFSPKIKKISLISGLVVMSLIADLPWLFVIGLLTVFSPK